MNPFGFLRYHLNVNLLGKSFLRLDRMRLSRRMRRTGFWRDEHLSPPLLTSPRLKELISSHYLKGRYANGHCPVAWVTSGGPVEFLVALGYYVLYPENHGAVCGIRRSAEDLCILAEGHGYSRDICSYARTDFGAMLGGKTPVGRLPRPDLLLCCSNICQTVLLWYRVLAHHFKVPLILVETPFLYRDALPHQVEYVKHQLEAGVEQAERVAGRTLAPSALDRVARLSKEASLSWAEIMACGKQRPAPITAFDEFIHMAPIVEMRGEQFTVDYYRAMLAELSGRIERGVGALANEKKRILWDNLPIWYRMRRLSRLLAERGVAMVASTYTNAWGELAEMMDSSRPLESAARVYLHPILNRGTGHKLETIKTMAKEYQADGIILHSDRSCKPYSVGQMDQREKLAGEMGLPALLLEADHNDPRVYSDEQAENRLEAFMEVLGV
ncbi:MAG TPA: 2-hydroxyacyl-CoA dehydratase family protein [Myxococcota bacterium]|nr:2-hydroxyacyl-CoA dehydratase family protein [Myxococcota bacterium]